MDVFLKKQVSPFSKQDVITAYAATWVENTHIKVRNLNLLNV